MPTYEYECTKGCRFELQQSIKDDALSECPKDVCPRGEGGVAVQRLISAANFILKGSGWYADGYSSGGGSSSESSKESSGGGDSSSSSKESASESSSSSSSSESASSSK